MLERLHQLETNIGELEKFKDQYSVADLNKNLQTRWILRYGIFESIQIVIDIACHLTAKYNLGNPQNYSECIKLLVEHEYLSGQLGDTLTGMTGLRNILIHEYVAVDNKRLFSLLDKLEDFNSFADAVKDLI